MRFRDNTLAESLIEKISSFKGKELVGLSSQDQQECFVAQLVDSVRRIQFFALIDSRDNSPNRANPASMSFDPLRASIIFRKNGDLNEAFWIAFLSVHFGKNRTTGWNLVRNFYGGLGNDVMWDWATITQDIEGFIDWLNSNSAALKATGNFGNHRKYESCNSRGTGAAIRSYIDWVGPENDHTMILENAVNEVGEDPKDLFKHLYRSAKGITRFGRMGAFDLLTSFGKLRLLPIVPDSTYLTGATGPVPGARLLFTGDANGNARIAELEGWLDELESHLQLNFGMQVLEDALCNWQKSPSNYKHFRG